MDKSIEFLNNNVIDESSVVVAVSGGPDSMTLLDLIIKIKDKKNLNVIVAHVNHNIREESKEEYSFVKNYCDKYNLIFEGTDFVFNNSNSIENIAREKRYNFFEELINKYNAKYLLTAHHGDDLVETILMKLTRGSSLDGYVGFKSISDRGNYYLLRPLIFYTKEEIMDYLKENNIEYRIDKTNFEKTYTRNRYRLDILPLLKQEYNNIHLKYLHFSEQLSENNEFINKYVSKKYDEIVNKNEIDLDKLLEEELYIIKKIIYKFLFNYYNNDINLIESKHINEVIELINNNKPNVELSMPNDIVLEKKYNKLSIKNYTKNVSYNIKLVDKVTFDNKEIRIIKETNLTNNYVTHLDLTDIKLPLYVRNKNDGDFIEVLNMNGKKKIKDIFIDSKIDKDLRDNYPVVVDSNNNVVWIPGLKKSKYDGLKQGKYDIILEYIDGGKNE